MTQGKKKPKHSQIVLFNSVFSFHCRRVREYMNTEAFEEEHDDHDHADQGGEQKTIGMLGSVAIAVNSLVCASCILLFRHALVVRNYSDELFGFFERKENAPFIWSLNTTCFALFLLIYTTISLIYIGRSRHFTTTISISTIRHYSHHDLFNHCRHFEQLLLFAHGRYSFASPGQSQF
jgi:hypothetical protein